MSNPALDNSSLESKKEIGMIISPFPTPIFLVNLESLRANCFMMIIAKTNAKEIYVSESMQRYSKIFYQPKTIIIVEVLVQRNIMRP